MVELLPDTPTVLLHVTEMSHNRVRARSEGGGGGGGHPI